MTEALSTFPEFDPPSEYDQMVEAVRARFVDALYGQQQNPGFVYVGIGHWDPKLQDGDSLVLFRLAHSYEAVVEGRGISFDIAIPVVEADMAAPLTSLGGIDSDSFVLTATSDVQSSVRIGADNFDEVMGSSILAARFRRDLPTLRPIPVQQFPQD